MRSVTVLAISQLLIELFRLEVSSRLATQAFHVFVLAPKCQDIVLGTRMYVCMSSIAHTRKYARADETWKLGIQPPIKSWSSVMFSVKAAKS